MFKVKGFNIKKEEFAIQDRGDIDMIERFGIEINDGKMIYCYVTMDTSEQSSQVLDVLISDELGINEEEYLALCDKYDMTEHPTFPRDASYFFNKEKANGFIDELKQIFIKEGMMEM